ncbi:MAG: hypothetical protein K9L99_06060 [Candidatus Omnitrophica bacterium]|nr:hypothetical protein [Candidatus Omnitrophota bacterium]
MAIDYSVFKNNPSFIGEKDEPKIGDKTAPQIKKETVAQKIMYGPQKYGEILGEGVNLIKDTADFYREGYVPKSDKTFGELSIGEKFDAFQMEFGKEIVDLSDNLKKDRKQSRQLIKQVLGEGVDLLKDTKKYYQDYKGEPFTSSKFTELSPLQKFEDIQMRVGSSIAQTLDAPRDSFIIMGAFLEDLEKGYQATPEEMMEKIDTKKKAKILIDELGKQLATGAKGISEGQLNILSGVLSYGERFGWDEAKDYNEKVKEWEEAVELKERNAVSFLGNLSGGISTLYLPSLGITSGVGMITSMSPKAINIVGNTAMTILESASEAGSTWEENINNGMDREEANARADIVFGVNLALLEATNKFEFAGLNTKRQVVKELSSRFMAGSREGTQEIGQQVASNIATGKKWDTGLKESGLSGFGMGFLLGGSPTTETSLISQEVEAEIMDIINQIRSDQRGFVSLPLFGKETSTIGETGIESTIGTGIELTPEPLLIEEIKNYDTVDDLLVEKDIENNLSNVYNQLYGKQKYTTQPSERSGTNQREGLGQDRQEGTRRDSGENISPNISKITEVIKNNPEGFTVSLNGEVLSSGFAVSPYKNREVVIEKLDRDSVKSFIKENKDLLFIEENYLGGWYNKADGKFYLDVSVVKDTLDGSLEIAANNEQIAFYDINQGKDVVTADVLKEKLTEVYNKSKQAVGETPVVTRMEENKEQSRTAFEKKVDKFLGRQQSPFIKKRGTTLLKDKIKTIARANSKARTLAKQEVAGVRKQIVDVLKKSNLDLGNGGKFLATIQNIQTSEQLKKVLPTLEERINRLIEDSYKRNIVDKIHKEMATTPAKGKKPKGKFTPEIQKELDFIKNVTDLNQKNARARLENNLKGDVSIDVAKENYLLSLYTGNVLQKQELLTLVQAIKQEGMITNEYNKYLLKEKFNNEIAFVVNQITGNKGIEEGRLKGNAPDKTRAQKAKQILKSVGSKLILDWSGLMEASEFNSSVEADSMSEIFSLNANEIKYKVLQYEYSEAFRGAFAEKYGIKNDPNSLFNLKHSMEMEKITIDNKIMSRSEWIKRYMEMQDPSLIQSLIEGNQYTEQTFQQIEETLSKQDKEFAKWQLDYYRKIYPIVNEVYKRMNGVDLPFRELYSPIKRSGVRLKNGEVAFLEEAFYRNNVTNKSLFSRVKNVLPIEKQSCFSAMDRYMTEANYYISWAEKVRELENVFKDSKVKMAYKQEFSESFYKAIENKIKHIADHGNITATSVGFLDSFRKNYVVGNLALKPALFVKQMVSVLAYGEVMSVKDLSVGIADFLQHPEEAWDILNNESAFIKTRGANMERDIKAATESDLYAITSKKDNLANQMLALLKFGDKGAIVAGSWALRKAKLAQGVPIQDVINEYENFSAETQQSPDISRLSEIQLAGSFGKLFTIFKSSQRAYLQKELNAVKSLFRQDGFTPKNVKKVAKTMFIYHSLLPMTFQFIANMGGTSEEDRKDYLRAGLLGSFNGLFLVGDILDSAIRTVINTFSAEESAKLPVWPYSNILVDLGDDFMKAYKKVTVEDITMEDFYEALEAISSAGTSMTGLPIEYIYDFMESFVRGEWETGIKEISGWSEYTINKNIKNSGVDKKRSMQQIYNKYK